MTLPAIDVDYQDLEEIPTLEQIQVWHISNVLTTVKGNKKQAAKILGINRATIHRKLKRLGITYSLVKAC